MAYWTTTTIRTNVWPVSTTEVTADIMTQIIADSEAELHSYISRCYSVPFGTCPDLVKGLAADIIRYRGQSRLSHKAGNLKESDRDAYDRAVKILENIRDGLQDIPGQTRLSTQTDGVYSNTMDYPNIFGVDDEMNWGVDDDRLDEIADDRS
jgi:phage gp36-like protein